jgi:type I restriction enzyme R subunit
VQALLFKAQTDLNELTGEADPVVQLIDFHIQRTTAFTPSTSSASTRRAA